MRRHAKAPSAQSFDASGGAVRPGVLAGGHGSGAPSYRRAGVFVLALSLAALALLPSSALAVTKGQISAFGSTGTGNGQFGFIGVSNAPRGANGVAISLTGAGGVTAGDVYVVDGALNRVQRFTADGDFVDSFGSEGTGGGQFSAPQGIAVDQSTGSVYVTDRANNRILKFTAQGDFLRTWGWGVLDGTEAFQICTSSQSCRAGLSGAGVNGGAGRMAGGVSTEISPRVAVDPLDGSVYVTDPGNRRVQVFDSAGNFLRAFGFGVIDGTAVFQVCTFATGCRGGATAAGTGNGQFGSNQPTRIAIDSTASPHVVYLSDSNSSNRVQRIDITAPAAPVPLAAINVPPLLSAPTVGLAVDTTTGNLLVGRDPSGSAAETVVQEVTNPANTVVPLPAVSDNHATGEGWIGSSTGTATNPNGLVGDIAIRPSNGRIYVSRPGVNQVAVLNQPGAQPTTGAPTITNNTPGTSATLNSAINPNGALTLYHFEYRLCPGGVCGSGTFTLVPATDVVVGSGAGTVNVSQSVTGLLPGATYEARAVADGFGAPVTTALTPFTTPAIKPALTQRPAVLVTDTTAELQAAVNPNNATTTYRFEWGTADCASNPCVSVPIPDEAIGAGGSDVVVSQTLTGLAPSTTYHFRVLATNATGTTTGTDQTFTTAPLASPVVVPSRGYELVSPAAKSSGQGVGSYSGGGDSDAGPGIAAVDGNRYISHSLAGNLTPGSFLYAVDYAFSERTADGWVARSPFTHHEYSPQGGSASFLDVAEASPDLETIMWSTSGTSASIFPEMAEGWSGIQPSYLSDWQGRWELLAPLQPPAKTTNSTYALADDGSRVLIHTGLQGQLGPDDLSLTQVANSSVVYEQRRLGPMSDVFEPNGELRLVGTCTGAGSDRTAIPVRDSAGKQGAQQCPPPSFGRDEALVSSFGASISRSISSSFTPPTEDSISADGQRIFFNSPDPGVTGSPSACTGTGVETACPTQVYIRQFDDSNVPTVRWISRSQVPNQDASLLGKAIFEGASADGSRVFFRTNSPLTADDPNGTGAAPVTTGTFSPTSWDLYAYDVPADDDPGAGSLTRISAGPLGSGDCNVSEGGTGGGVPGALRFASDDGSRVYFVCSGTLPGVATDSAPTDGTTTTASGTASTSASRNLYLYDATKPLAQRWEFVAQLPTGGAHATCATRATFRNSTMGVTGNGSSTSEGGVIGNCMGGTSDGSFITFLTPGKLVSGDPESASGDVYAFDAEADELIRISAPQGGVGGTYGCLGPLASPTGLCNGDHGYRSLLGMPGVATEPSVPGDRIAFFQSKSRLVAEDTNSQYDVYEWRNGKLTLLSAGSGDKGSYYSGNSASGRDVFIETRDQLSWQDFDAVMDVYDARVGGGIPEPPAPPPGCDALAEGCQAGTGPAPSPSSPGSAGFAGPGNVSEPSPPVKCRKGFVRRKGKCVKKPRQQQKPRHTTRKRG